MKNSSKGNNGNVNVNINNNANNDRNNNANDYNNNNNNNNNLNHTHKDEDGNDNEDNYNNNDAINNNNNNKQSNKAKDNKKHLDYAKEVLAIINRVRTNPSSFIPDIKKAMNYIKESNGKLIYASKLKVSLFKGEEAFIKASEVLSTMPPLEPLIFNEELIIDCPEDETELKDSKAFMKRILEKKKTTQLDAYFKDAVKDPYISALLIIIDDSKNNAGRKRDTVLNKDYKYVGITSSRIGKTFCAYFSFAK